jgi:hypothetical protein
MKLDGKQKRIAAAVAAGGVLALVVLLSRKSGSAEAGNASGVANDPNSTGLPSSFADNGAAMGQLTTTVTDLAGRTDTALGNFADQLVAMDDREAQRSAAQSDTLATAIGGFSSAIAGLGTMFAAATHDPPAVAPPAQIVFTGNPAAPAGRAAPGGRAGADAGSAGQHALGRRQRQVERRRDRQQDHQGPRRDLHDQGQRPVAGPLNQNPRKGPHPMINIARAVLTSGTAHDDVHILGGYLAQLGYPNSVSRGENPFGIVDDSILSAVALFRNAQQVEPETTIPGVPSHEASRWIGPVLWEALVTEAGNLRKFSK